MDSQISNARREREEEKEDIQIQVHTGKREDKCKRIADSDIGQSVLIEISVAAI
jgi:hypothetical protein